MTTDGVTIDPHSMRELEQLATAFKGGDKVLQKRIRSSLQESAKPLATDVIREGAQVLPSRGGLRERVAAARGGVTASLAGRNVSVSIRARTREGYALKKFDEGEIRHKVFGRWVKGIPTQRIRAHAFSDAFERGAPRVQANLRVAVQRALDDIAREAS